MKKRSCVAIPEKLSPQFEAVAHALLLNVNQFAVRCLEDCLAAILADQENELPIVRLARHVLRKDSYAADRLLLDLLMKAFPDLSTQPDRFKSLLIEEANRIVGDLSHNKLNAAHNIALARFHAELHSGNLPFTDVVLASD